MDKQKFRNYNKRKEKNKIEINSKIIINYKTKKEKML